MEVNPKIYEGLPLVHCDLCGSEAAQGATCPWAVACRTCGAPRGVRCKRPSGHEAMQLHKVRWVDAERMDTVNLTLRDPLRQALGQTKFTEVMRP